MKVFIIFWLIFWPFSMCYFVFYREINKAVKKKYRKIQVKRNIHKVGYKDYFGFLRPESVVFYDLGDTSAL